MTTTTHVNIPTPGQPALVSLPADSLACGGCGVAVERPTVVSRVAVNGYQRDGRLQRQDVVRLTRCEACAAIDDAAASALGRSPEVVGRLGGVARQSLVAALSALATLGLASPSLDSAADVVRLIDRLGIGGAVRFESQATPDTCSSAPWAHVGEELRATLREAGARWLREGIERPVRVAPPADSDRRGCLFCGVGHVMAMPSRADSVWTATSTTLRTLGGHSTAVLDGDTCPTCAAAIEHAGSVGIGAMQRAVLDFVGYRPTGPAGADLELAVIGWGALPPGTTPNATPWQHLDVDALRRDLDGMPR
ncbi:hypothetical protein AB0P19_03645 [Microbacterium oleivorans]|uniref:hypothetical protein n=1 Tax=Microbacterium oleivorans TaxID=273677 RepID=UPI0033C07EBA